MYNSLIFELSKKGRVGYSLPNNGISGYKMASAFKLDIRRS